MSTNEAKFTITIKTNRIYFESFEAPCGQPERDEIRAAWERTACEVIENAGYKSQIEIGVGHDPAREWYLDYGDHWSLDWSRPADRRPAEIAFVAECDCDECDNAEAEELWKAAMPIIRRDVKRVAEEAIEAADEAAQALSDHFVKQSEATENEEV